MNPQPTTFSHEERPAEPTQAAVRTLLQPLELLAELSWSGSEQELGLPIPCDVQRLVDPDAELSIAVAARTDARGLRSTLCSILERVDVPVAVSVLLDSGITGEVAETAGRLEQAVPGLRIIRGDAVAPGTHVLAEGEELPWGFPDAVSSPRPAVEVAYLLPGLPPEGSGGSHSLVQEARGLRRLGCQARICVPLDSLEVVSTLYGNEDDLFVAYGSPEEILDAIGPANVAVATEHPSLSMLQRISEERPEIVCAYYVQDYEPLFGVPESARADRALLSYRAIPGQLLFSKAHWLRNVVTARHGVLVAKVRPSLDREIFHTQGRVEGDGVLRVAAMVRPRTPRRRPFATLQALQAIRAQLGQRVRTITFGCDAGAYAQLVDELGADTESEAREAGAEHLGLLTREQVAREMRRCDVFIDASAYQAFGRSGLEAMACGAVPVLPALGGVGEYAEHESNSLIFEDDSPAAIAELVLTLLGDDGRLRRLREDGLLTATRFAIQLAAESQLEMFAAAFGSRASSTTVST